MFIWYTGELFGLTPFRSKFIDFFKADVIIKDVTNVNQVVSIGATIHNFYVNDTTCYFPCVCYHLPSKVICFFTVDLTSDAWWTLYIPWSSHHDAP